MIVELLAASVVPVCMAAYGLLRWKWPATSERRGSGDSSVGDSAYPFWSCPDADGDSGGDGGGGGGGE